MINVLSVQKDSLFLVRLFLGLNKGLFPDGNPFPCSQLPHPQRSKNQRSRKPFHVAHGSSSFQKTHQHCIEYLRMDALPRIFRSRRLNW